MKKSKLTVLIKISFVCFCQLVLVGLTKAQVNYCRARDSIENSYKRIHLQNEDYKTKDYSDCVTRPHCGTDEAYRQRLIENPEILENEKRINEQIKNNSYTSKVDTIINAREEELKKIYYDKLKLEKIKTDLSQQPKDTIYYIHNPSMELSCGNGFDYKKYNYIFYLCESDGNTIHKCVGKLYKKND